MHGSQALDRIEERIMEELCSDQDDNLSQENSRSFNQSSKAQDMQMIPPENLCTKSQGGNSQNLPSQETLSETRIMNNNT